MPGHDHPHAFASLLPRVQEGLTLSTRRNFLKAGLAGLSELVAKLKAPNAEPLTIEVVEAMTTNESFFFRDRVPFEQFREVAHVSHLRRVPGAPAGVAGLVNLRGEILCALDVRAILGLPAAASSAAHSAA